MGDMTSAVVTGTLIGDPVVTRTGSNGRVANFTVESIREFTKKDGILGTERATMDCCAYANAADAAALAKNGDSIIARGRLREPRGQDTDVEYPPIELVVEDFLLQEA